MQRPPSTTSHRPNRPPEGLDEGSRRSPGSLNEGWQRGHFLTTITASKHGGKLTSPC
jgi:hypothetical protein